MLIPAAPISAGLVVMLNNSSNNYADKAESAAAGDQ